MDGAHEWLNADLREFVDKQIAEGRFGSREAVLTAAVALMREQRRAATEIDRLLQEAEDSGPPEVFDLDSFLAEMHGRS